MYANIKYLLPDSLDPMTITPDHLRVGFWLRPPYRIRVGELRHFFIPAPVPADIWIHNRTAIPKGTRLNEAMKLRPVGGEKRSRRPNDHLWSDVLVVVKPSSVSDAAVDSFKTGDGFQGLPDQTDRALVAFNTFLCAYVVATKEVMGGARLRMLTDAEMYDYIYAQIMIGCEAKYAINDSDARSMLEWQPGLIFASLSAISDSLDDLDEGLIDSIGKAFSKVADHPFYEIAFKASTESDPIIALVLACAALEGAHAAFLRDALNDKLVPHGKAGLIQNLLREQGIHTLVQISALTLLPEQARPDQNLLNGCVRGIEIRNGIMHVKSSGKGYDIRRYTPEELHAGYEGLMGMYRVFVRNLGER